MGKKNRRDLGRENKVMDKQVGNWMLKNQLKWIRRYGKLTNKESYQ